MFFVPLQKKAQAQLVQPPLAPQFYALLLRNMSDVSEEFDENCEFVERVGPTGAFDHAVGPAPGCPQVREPTEDFYIGE